MKIGFPKPQLHQMFLHHVSSLYILRKDHKPLQPGSESKGPPGRPVCAANDAPNSRFSNFLSNVLTNYSDNENDHKECRNSEEMRACLEHFNETTACDDKKKCMILSMDVKSLYPSLRIDP